MALFRRNKKESVLPELDKYYDGERRDRTGLAWILALISVIIIALIIIGIFLAGRWAYRELTGDDNGNEVAIEETVPSFDGESTIDNQDSDDASQGEDNGSSQGDAGVNQPQPQDQDSDTDTETDTGSEASEGTVDAPARTDVPSVPRTGDDDLPSTGPAGIVGTFVGTSLVAGGAHYVVARKRQSNRK